MVTCNCLNILKHFPQRYPVSVTLLQTGNAKSDYGITQFVKMSTNIWPASRLLPQCECSALAPPSPSATELIFDPWRELPHEQRPPALCSATDSEKSYRVYVFAMNQATISRQKAKRGPAAFHFLCSCLSFC